MNCFSPLLQVTFSQYSNVVVFGVPQMVSMHSPVVACEGPSALTEHLSAACCALCKTTASQRSRGNAAFHFLVYTKYFRALKVSS